MKLAFTSALQVSCKVFARRDVCSPHERNQVRAYVKSSIEENTFDHHG